MLGGTVDRGREMDIAQTAPATAGDLGHLLDAHQVGEQGPRRVVVHGGAGRDRRAEIRAGLAVALRTCPSTAGARLEMAMITEFAEGRLARIDAQRDGSAAAAIAAVGTTARDVGLASERGRAVTAVTGACQTYFRPYPVSPGISSRER